MKLTINKIKELFTALSTLDGYEKVVGDKIIKVPYDFNGKIKWNIAKNMKLLRNSLETFDKVRDDLIKEISGGKDQINIEDKENLEIFNKKIAEVLIQEEEIGGLLKIKLSDLKLKDEEKKIEGNPIPQTVLLSMMELIDEE